MIEWPKPENEALRLQELRSLVDISKDLDQEFENFSKIAAKICDSDIALINFIGDDLQWSKASFGIDLKQMARCDSVCQYTILDDKYYEVPDLKADERFSTKFYVAGNPELRFYGGYPLTSSNGLNIGALCVLDPQPKQLNSFQQQVLKTLANAIVTRIELQKKVRDLTQKNDDVYALMRVIGHDLRNPIAGVIGASDWMISSLEENNTPQKNWERLIQIMKKSARSLLIYTNEILELGLSSSNQETQIHHLDVILSEIIDLYSTFAHTKGVELSYLIDKADYKLAVNSAVIKQIVGNLVSNALKFTPTNGTVQLHLRKSDESILITIIDSGIGMNTEVLSSVQNMEKAVQRQGTDGEKSSGLGIPLVKKLVSQLGGNLLIDSVENQGSTFVVKLPIS
jgi:signal transduction histidine kinase